MYYMERCTLQYTSLFVYSSGFAGVSDYLFNIF